MNKRKKKKRIVYESDCEERWGYIMSYKELKKQERMYHEDVVVNHYYRNTDNSDEYEEVSCILGIPFENNKKKYLYPNRVRCKTIRGIEGNGFHKLL